MEEIKRPEFYINPKLRFEGIGGLAESAFSLSRHQGHPVRNIIRRDAREKNLRR